MLLMPPTLQDVVKHYTVFLKRSILLSLIYFKLFSFFSILLIIKFIDFHGLSKFDVFRYPLKIKRKYLKPLDFISQCLHGSFC